MKLLRIIRDWLRFEFFGVNLEVMFEAVRANGAYIRNVVIEINRLRASMANLTALLNVVRTNTKGLVISMATQEQRLQAHLALLTTLGEGITTIISALNDLREKNENPAINDELDLIDLATQEMAAKINAVLNPEVATGAPVATPDGTTVPVHSGNEGLIIGGTTNPNAQPNISDAGPSSPPVTEPDSGPGDTGLAEQPPVSNAEPSSPPDTVSENASASADSEATATAVEPAQPVET